MRPLKLRLLATLALACSLAWGFLWPPAWAASPGKSPQGKVAVSSPADDRERGGKPAASDRDTRNDPGGRSDTKDGSREEFARCKGGRLTGAIFTTTEVGVVVNGNLYENPLDVYLAVGRAAGVLPGGQRRMAPRPRHDSRKTHKTRQVGTAVEYRHGNPGGVSSGLPDGMYYFQVTDPSGTQLLSLGGVEDRQFTVVDGYIQGLSGSHDFNVLEEPFPLNYTVIQLAPYVATPNRGGEYKVWVTPVGAYRPGQGSHGFLASCSKTDTFKVRSRGNAVLAAYITGGVFWDANLDGIWNATGSSPESPQPNVQVNVYPAGSPEPIDFMFTSTTGQWGFQLFPPSLPYTYRVEPVLLGGGLSLAPTLPPAYDVTFDTSGQAAAGILFGVVGIGDSGANIRFTPAYWDTPGSQGETVLNAYWDQAYDPDFPPDFLRALLLQQCPNGSSLTSVAAIQTFLLVNGNDGAPAACRAAAFWLGLHLAIAVNGVVVASGENPGSEGLGTSLTDSMAAALLDAGQVSSVTGNELVYFGIDPVSAKPRFDRLGNLLAAVASGFAAFTPEETAFYLAALQQAADNFSFVQAPPGQSGGL